MNNNATSATLPHPAPINLILVVIGPTMLAAGFGMFTGPQWLAALGFVAGCALAAMAWRWPKVAGPMLLILSIPGLFYGLVITFYTLGMPPALVALWGSAAFLTGGLGVLRRRSAAQRPGKHFAVQAGVAGTLAAAFLLFFVILWPARGKAILLNLPIMQQAATPLVQAEAGGIWAGYWTTPRVTIPQALESVKGPLEADGWTIVDSSMLGRGIPLVSAQRGAFSLEVIYVPDAPRPYWSTGAYMAAYVRRGQARRFPTIDANP